MIRQKGKIIQNITCKKKKNSYFQHGSKMLEEKENLKQAQSVQHEKPKSHCRSMALFHYKKKQKPLT